MKAVGEILDMSLNSHLRPLRGSSTIFSLLLSTMTQKHCEDSGGHWRGLEQFAMSSKKRRWSDTGGCGANPSANFLPFPLPVPSQLSIPPNTHKAPPPPQGPSPLHPLICQHFPFSSPPYTTQHSLLCLLMLLQSCNSCKSMITLVTFKRTDPAQSKIYFIMNNV